MWLAEVNIDIYGDGPDEIVAAIREKLEEIDLPGLVRSALENIPNLEGLRIEVP